MTTLLASALADGGSNGLLELLSTTLHLLMDAEVDARCGAGYGERSPDRVNSRNGSRDRLMETTLGSVDLAIPKLRKDSYFPSFLTPRRRWEQAFVNVVATAYVEGVSTRAMDNLVQAMGIQGVSRSEVSRMAKSLDEQVEAFRNRPLDDKAYPYVWLDAMYVKVRIDKRVRSRAVFVAIGVNEDGEREVLAVDIARKEMESSWRDFLRDLVDRRKLHGVRCVMSDAHEGLRKAITAVFNDVTWQRCYVHFMRNVLDKVSKTAQPLVKGALRNIFHQTSREAASEALGKAVELLEEKHTAAAELLLDAEDDVLAYFAFPQDHWRQIRSTNPLERLNKELRRRVRAVGLFPDEASVLRLLGSILVEQDDEWRVASRRYFSVSSMAQLGLMDQEVKMLPAVA
ncbi:MAG TPA: IS256 family transposase [Myxococcota bacterium]|nr:IS256 family transposase [Myxococcota bacterium]